MQVGDAPPARRTVAIMQPYYLPYAGYFRLLAAADLFVLYDCVQFPRRGWVHRNRLTTAGGALAWLTLPLAAAPRDALIRDLHFRTSAASEFAAQARRFPALGTAAAAGLLAQMTHFPELPSEHIVRLLRWTAGVLGLPWHVLSSSTLSIDPSLHGEQRILAIVRAVGADRYVNPPGGRALYDPARFAAAGVELRFLPPYEASMASIAERLATEPLEHVAAEIRGATRLVA